MSRQVDQAADLYEAFHKRAPKRMGEFHSLRIPHEARFVGEAVHVLYRSAKRDPETLKIPRRPIDYIHEHEGKVVCCRCDTRSGTVVEVPGWIHRAAGLVRLGECLGFAYADERGTVEAEARAPLPVLYAIPSGKALVVVQSERKVLTMMWGGDLDVRPEGIVG